jgi:hypothetical protein
VYDFSVPCTRILFYINYALSDSFLPSKHISSLTFSDFDTFLNTRQGFLQAKLVDEEPVLARAVP